MKFESILSDFLEGISPKLFCFQETGYSFEEWLNWELYFILKSIGYEVTPKPKILGEKSFADLEIAKFDGENSLIIEVKTIHDFTQDKWIEAIEKDRRALNYNSINTNNLGLQILVLASSYNDVFSVESWSSWLEKLSFWCNEPDFRLTSNQEEGASILLAWKVNG